MKLIVYLGSNAEDQFVVNIYENDFTIKWINELQWCLNNSKFDQKYSFAAFLSIEEQQYILLDAIHKINKFLKKEFIKLPDIVDWQDQHFFNYIHMCFEKLAGGYENQTKLFLIAPAYIKQAIRDLNYFVHLIESNTNSHNIKFFSLQFDKETYRRKAMDITDYTHFSHDRKIGGLYLSYAEVGKTFRELYKDNLPKDYPGVKNSHYYSGECYIKFYRYEDDGYYQWCIDNQIDYEDKTLGHGFIELGNADSNLEEIKFLLQKHKNLHSIKIERD